MKTIKTRRLGLCRGLTLSTLCLALGACAVGPDYKRPELQLPAQYTRGDAPLPAADAAPQAAWWKAFGLPELDAAVEQALKNSPNIGAAEAALRQARANTAAQFGSFFPTVQASYSPSRQRNAVGTLSPTLSNNEPLYTLHTAQLSVSFAPDVFGLNRRTVESLQAQEEVQQLQLDAARQSLAANLVSGFVQAASLQEQLQAAQEIVQSNERTLAAVRRQRELGFSSEMDVAAQVSALAQAQQALPPLRKQLEQTRDLIATLMGQAPGEAALPAFQLAQLKLADPPLSLPSTLVRQRPDVRAAEAQVHAATAQVGVAVANRLPQFNISATDGGTATAFGSMFASGNKFWTLTGSVSQTLFDFGTLKAKQEAAQAALEQTQAQYRGAVLTAFQNMADSLYALKHDGEALQAAEQGEAAAQRTLTLTQRQFELGAVNGLTLWAAQQAYQQARQAAVQARSARLLDTVALYLALAGPV